LAVFSYPSIIVREMQETSHTNSYIWVDSPPSLKEMLAQLRASPLMAVDTESDSLYVYFEKVCLLQFSIPGVDFLVDPLRIDATPLGDLFASQEHEKVFHASEYDIMCLKRDYGFTFANLFDTMIAARVLGWPHYGLGPILQERFGVQMDKRLQRYNWGTRPLSDQALDYAHMDTHYLLDLRDVQLQELGSRGRLVEAREAFKRQTRVQPVAKTFDPDGFWHVAGARDLDRVGQALLRELYIFRDRLAQEIDEPPFKVIPDTALVRLAAAHPVDRRDLSHIKGLSSRIRKKHSDGLLRAIALGLRAQPPAYPNHTRRQVSDETLNRYEALRSWRKEIAEARQVEPDVVLSNHTLMELARRPPSTSESLTQVRVLDDWQRQTYGEDLLQVLRDHTH
jgi:ribonuclease D